MTVLQSSGEPVAVTGAAGFIGRAVVSALRRRGCEVRALVRTPAAFSDPAVEVIPVGDLAKEPDLQVALSDAWAVIHLAGRAHVLDNDAEASLQQFTRANVAATEHLARAACAAGVRRFVFASSVAVYGSVTPPGRLAAEDDPFAPDRPYGVSKVAAEQRLQSLAQELGLSLATLRPPAVYGVDAPGHFAKLVKAARLGLPLPIGGIKNRRSFIYVENLADAFAVAVQSAAQGAFNVTDSQPMSTADLYVRLGRAVGRPVGAWAWPRPLVEGLARAALGPLRAESLLGSMAVDGSRFAAAFGWSPSITLDEALARTASGGAH